jgi:hypothetical protein
MIKQSKITVKHYLNTDLKPTKSPLGNEYKIYFLLRYLNQNTKIKSLILNTLTEDEYLEIDKDKILINWQAKEVQLCENTIFSLEKFGYYFDIKTFMQFYEYAKYPILANFESFIEWQKDRFTVAVADFHEKENFENQIECLLNLKKLVYNNQNFINNEIYLGCLKDFKKDLSKIKINIYERLSQENQTDSYINPKYELKKYSFLDYFINNIMIKYAFKVPKIDILPPKLINDREFAIMLIGSFTKG